MAVTEDRAVTTVRVETQHATANCSTRRLVSSAKSSAIRQTIRPVDAQSQAP